MFPLPRWRKKDTNYLRANVNILLGPMHANQHVWTSNMEANALLLWCYGRLHTNNVVYIHIPLVIEQ